MPSEMLAPPDDIQGRDAMIMARLAHEGVPVRAIARSFTMPSEVVRESLQYAVSIGTIVAVPKDDWPPKQTREQHAPQAAAALDDNDMLIGCQRALRLTRLEASFMVVFLKRNEADKTTLHAVNEQQRSYRGTRPNNTEPTDPKIVDVVICKMRKKLKEFGIQINTLWGAGYFISPEHRTIAFNLIGALHGQPNSK